MAARVERLESRELLTVTYHGGALISNVEAQAVYLGSAWQSNPTQQSQAQATDKFLATLVQSPYMDMLTNAGYNVGRGSASAGIVDNLSFAANSTITDGQIQADLQSLISSGQVQAPDANRLYVVYVEPGVVVQNGTAASNTTFLGYHGAFAGRTSAGNPVDIHYAVLPSPGTPNPSPASQGFSSSFNELTSVTSHELAEAVTDPNVNYKTLGWYDDQLNGEIGDLTRLTTTMSGYVVQDVVNQNDQPISPGVVQSPPPNPGLTAPVLTGSAVSTTVAQLSWTAVSGTQGYRVYEIIGGQPVLLGTVGPSTTAVQVTGLAAGSKASFEVEAFNSSSVADSNVVTVTMPTPHVAPVSVPQVTAHATSSTSVVLSWGSDPQAQGFRIYWSDGFQVVLLGTVGAGTTSVTINGLAPGSSSYFLVEAFNRVSYADSQWVYAATPAFAIANGAVASQDVHQARDAVMAEFWSGNDASGNPWARGRSWE